MKITLIKKELKSQRLTSHISESVIAGFIDIVDRTLSNRKLLKYLPKFILAA